MRILFATTDRLDRSEAPSHHVLHTCGALASLGHEVTVLHRAGREPAVRVDGARLRFVGVPWVPLRGWGRVFPFLFARRLGYLLNEGGYNWLLIRVTPHRRIFEVVQESRIPVGAFHIGREHLGNQAVRAIAEHITLFFTNSEKGAAVMSRELGIPAERFKVVLFSGVDPSVFAGSVDRKAVRARYGLDAEAFLVAHVSSFRPHHDFDTLFGALEQLDFPHELALIGAGTRVEEIRRKAGRLGARVRFLGSLPLPAVAAVLRASDACVDPLVRECALEGNLRPAKLWEYIASGTPVVETVGPGLPLPDWARQSLGLAPAEDPLAVARLLRDIHDHPAEWQEKAAEAREWVVANQSWTRVAADCVAAMEKAAGYGGRV